MRGFPTEVVYERIEAVNRLDKNTGGRLTSKEIARRLSAGRPEIGPFHPRTVARYRRLATRQQPRPQLPL